MSLKELMRLQNEKEKILRKNSQQMKDFLSKYQKEIDKLNENFLDKDKIDSFFAILMISDNGQEYWINLFEEFIKSRCNL